MQKLPKVGVGLGFQAPLKGVFEDRHSDVDFIEVVPDILWTDLGPGHTPRYFDDPTGLALLRQARRRRPIVAHSIGASIGSAQRFDMEHVRQIRRWCRRMQVPWHSDHLAFHLVEEHGRCMNAGVTLPLPRDRATLGLLVPRITAVMRCVPLPFLLENNVYYFDIPCAEMDEATFLNRLCHESGCGLLLDLHNLYTNARNHGFDPGALLAELDLSQVGEIHVAGGMELHGMYLDAHSDVVPDPVWALLEWTLPRCPNVGGVVFELFGSWFEDVGETAVRRDLRWLKALWKRTQQHDRSVSLPTPVPVTHSAGIPA
ncbi:MAG TPA: DUF692 family protein [Povalibacter sp.]|nr:DUF692 family protein [Povalibacter sp.]